MSESGNSRRLLADNSAPSEPGNHSMSSPLGSGDPLAALTNLAAVRTRMDSLQRFLGDSINRNTLLPAHQMDRVSSELVSAIHQVIVNGATLLAFSQTPTMRPDLPDPDPINPNLETSGELTLAGEESDKEDERIEGEDMEIVELDAVELLAEHIHFCEICGKGFKRDANLRMHMRAHGNQFKTPEALAKPDRSTGDSAGGGGGRRRMRFSCPYEGCNRNQRHKNFRPLKSVICVKNHFKRSHCPKTYSCNRCHKKSFSVMADLKSHVKYCGNSRWKCSCGTTFSRKDKLFGHMALFEGHMPAVAGTADEENNPIPAVAENEPPVASAVSSGGVNRKDELGNELLLEGLLDDFGFIDDQCLQDLMMAMGAGASSFSSVANLNPSRNDDFFNF